MTTASTEQSQLNRTLVLIYGLVSYICGVVGQACLIFALATLIPFGFMNSGDTSGSVGWNIFLVAAWGFIHTGMARDGFKNWLTRWIPEPAERPTYVLVAGITSCLLVGLWQPIPSVIWSTDNQIAVIALWSVFVFGWVYLLGATFAINHFDLFGLRQVYMHYRNLPRPPLEFTQRAMYRITRHPIQTGILIGIWATPEMLATQLVLSIGFTVYIFIGLWFEEKDLLKEIGEPYEQYRNETGAVFPKLIKRK